MSGLRKRCVFCGRSDVKITKEHAWPNWIRALFAPGISTVIGFATPLSPFLTPMIRDGAATVLDSHQQRRLGAWACKTSMVFEFTSTEPPFFNLEQRDDLRRTTRPPNMLLGVFVV